MAGGLKKYQVGEIVTEIAASTHNRMVDATDYIERIRAGGGFGREDSIPGIPHLTIDVLNDTAADLTARFPIVGLGDPTIVIADSAEVYNDEPVFRGIVPVAEDHEGRFAVLQRPLIDGETGEAVISGMTWVEVNVIDAADDTCGVVDDDTDKLKSGIGDTPILWKATGTGNKWAIINISGGAKGVPGESGLAVTSGEIPAMTVGLSAETHQGTVLLGSGNATALSPTGNGTEWGTSGGPLLLFNATTAIVGAGKIVQWMMIEERRVINAEDCS